MDIYSIIIFAVLIMIIISQFTQMKRTKEINDRLKKIVSDSNEQYQDVVEINKNLKHIRHDINKQRSILRDIKEGESVENMTGVEVIDRILHFKGKERSEKDISSTVETIPVSSLKVGNGALISILTNIFDNAIEACSGLEKRWISCRMIENKQYGLHMIVENSKDNEVKLDVKHISTTKADKDMHGYGVAIIKELVEKNGGELLIEDRGDAFLLDFKV